MTSKKNREFDEDIYEKKSKRPGIMGIVDNILRSFQNVGFLALAMPLLLILILSIGIACIPGTLLSLAVLDATGDSSLLVRGVSLSLCIGAFYWLYAFCVIFVVPIFNFPIIKLVNNYRGPWFSFESVPWYFHNALLYIVRYTVLDMLTPSPLNTLFYKMMGMKMGKGVMINTSNISDACRIELGDYVTIGGSATIMAHYGMKGYLIIDKLVIGKGATIGLNANVFGGVTIGRNSTIAPGAVVLPKTTVGDGEKFGL